MENSKQVGGSSSSITLDLFGPKNSASSSSLSSGLFGSIFQSPSLVPGGNTSYAGNIGSSRMQVSGNQVGNGKYGSPDNLTQISNGESSKDRSSIYHNEPVEPCYFSSSIYYGGQEVYSPTARSTKTDYHRPIIKKDGGEDDPSDSASRGNWWQGSLYY